MVIGVGVVKRKKVAVSACLLGEVCRYDGATKQNDTVIEALKGAEIIPFCPEAPVLGTPRERISVISDGEGMKIIGDESKRDVTDLLVGEIEQFIDTHPDVDSIVLKSKSPSCGLGTTPILDSDSNVIGYGDGIAASMLKDAFENIDISDENSFI